MRPNVLSVRLSVFICIFTLFTLHIHGQSISTGNGKLEIGLGLGPMFFLGDLGGTKGVGRPFVKDLNFPLTKLNKGLYLNIYPVEWVGFRIAGNLGYVEGDDAEAPAKGGSEEDRKYRNLSFRSKISEAYAAIELYPTYFMEQYEELQGKFRPYVVAGIGLFHFNPEAKDPADGKYYKLAPLRLEGQGFAEYPDSKPYKLTQMNIQMGFGFKYYFKENAYIGLEILHRKLFTDYVDDVSHNYYIDPIYFDNYLTPANAARARRMFYKGIYSFPTSRPYVEFAERGDPKQNDAFFSSILRLGWRLNNNGNIRQLRCPVFY
jgi:hypothetical protein